MPALNSITLRSEVRRVATLGPADRQAMHRLMAAHYEAVPRERFDADLSRKQEVIFLRDTVGGLRGFTTLAWNPCGGLPAGEWRAASGRRLFWLLISKGHRTYLYLPLFAHRFHPHPERSEPELAALADRIAGHLFGSGWLADEGVIRFPESLGHLRPDLAADTVERERNPWVRHFTRLNPGYARGEELVCLTEMSRENLRRVALAEFVKGAGDTP